LHTSKARDSFAHFEKFDENVIPTNYLLLPGDTDSDAGSDASGGGGVAAVAIDGVGSSKPGSKGERSHLIVWQVSLPSGPPKPPVMF